MRSMLIKSINPNKPSTWEDYLFLTFDIDWACDDVLAYTIDMVEEAGVYATWFVTHDTPLLERLRENPKFELGIHPNFNNILAGKYDPDNGKSAEQVIDKLLSIVPEARSVRSHSLTQSSKLVQLFVEKGLTHDCNYFIPHQTRINLCPWYFWNSIIKVPHFWEDDISFVCNENLDNIEVLTRRKGLKVFDFHPIHVFLNTENKERYETARLYYHSPEVLMKLRNNETFGTGDALRLLLSTLAT